MNNDFKKFIVKLMLFGSPVLLILLSYFIFDPFEIVYKYENYPTNYGKTVNRNRISTQVFLNNNPTLHYKSFILGSSRSSVFYTADYGKYLNDTLVYHFDASNETMGGILNKIRFIEKQGNKIENALILLDQGSFEYPIDTAGTIFIEDYRVAPNVNFLKYQFLFISSYFKDFYFVKFLDFKCFHTLRPYMKSALERRKIIYTPIHNDFIFKSYEDEIKNDSLEYYSRDYFFKRDTAMKVMNPIIKPYQEEYIKEISRILKSQHTNYQIIISPNYDQLAFNKKDIEILEKYFGKNKIYNYSGKNHLTEPIGNYYEIFHFKPFVAQEILKEIFTNN